MKLSIVIPSFNEEKNISPIYKQIIFALKDYEFECIFVDDGSTDNTFDEIKKISETDSRVKGISFSRNFGHQTALFAGLKESENNIIITLDADGQHPPSIIPKLIEEYQKGFDIVNTRRISTEGVSYFKKISSKWYYKILNILTDIKIDAASSDFRLMTKKTTDAFLQIDEKNRFTRGLVKWIGFKQSIIEFKAPERMTGKSKYTFRKMFRFAFDGITSFSSKPLKFSIVAGLFSLIAGILYSVYIIIMYSLDKTTPGWASMMLVILFLGGFQLLSIGIIGEYISGIFKETKNRPHYFIKDKC